MNSDINDNKLLSLGADIKILGEENKHGSVEWDGDDWGNLEKYYFKFIRDHG